MKRYLIIGGQRIAFKDFYDSHNQKVYNIALNYMQNIQDAEEVTQDVFIKVYQNAEKFKGRSSITTWIYRITVNTSLNYLKSKKKNSAIQLNESHSNVQDFHHPGVKLEQKENSIALFKAINKLPESQKTAFILSYIEDLPRNDVAEIMENSLKATESLLQRAKKNLREILVELYPYRRK